VIARRYLTAAKAYSTLGLNDDELASKVEKSLEKEIDVELKTKADTAKYSTATRYFSFANYSILACVITIICLIMMSFNRMEVRKRNLVSSIEISKMNRTLLKNCCIYSLGVWALFVVIGFFVLGFDVLWSIHGLLYIANTLVFAGCATTVAFLVSQFVTSQGAVSGMMNVIALGSSFLCGAFVPAEYLPGAVLGFAHIMPSYYFIDASNKIMALEDYSFASLLPILINMVIVLVFAIGFALITNYVSKKKQKIA
jgi:ABC-2 type transport system permease protein